MTMFNALISNCTPFSLLRFSFDLLTQALRFLFASTQVAYSKADQCEYPHVGMTCLSLVGLPCCSASLYSSDPSIAIPLSLTVVKNRGFFLNALLSTGVEQPDCVKSESCTKLCCV